jgi:hypothetical protein
LTSSPTQGQHLNGVLRRTVRHRARRPRHLNARKSVGGDSAREIRKVRGYVGTPRRVQVQMVPERRERIVGTEQDHVTGFVDVKKFNVVRRIEKGNRICGRHRNVVTWGVVHPFGGARGALCENCEVTCAGSIREDTFASVGRRVRTAEHGGGVEVTLERLRVPWKRLRARLDELIKRQSSRRRRSSSPRRILRDDDAR